MAPVPVVASGLASTYLPQQHPHPQYVQQPQQQQYLTQQQQQQQYVDSLLTQQQPQILDRRLTGATLSYENGIYGTILPHSDHAATAGGIYTSSGLPIGAQGSIYPTTQTHAGGTLIQGHYTSPAVIAARVPQQGQLVRSPLMQSLVAQNYPTAVAGRRINQVPMYTTATTQVDRQALAPAYLNQPICTNLLGAQVACY